MCAVHMRAREANNIIEGSAGKFYIIAFDAIRFLVFRDRLQRLLMLSVMQFKYNMRIYS